MKLKKLSSTRLASAFLAIGLLGLMITGVLCVHKSRANPPRMQQISRMPNEFIWRDRVTGKEYISTELYGPKTPL